MARKLTNEPLRWRAHPMLSIAGCLAAGVWISSALTVPSGFWSIVFGGFLGGLVLVSLYRPRRLVSLKSLFVTLGIAALLLALGGLRYEQWKANTQPSLSRFAAEVDSYEHAFPVTVFGRVADFSTRNERRVRFSVQVDSGGFSPYFPLEGLLDVTIWQPLDEEIPNYDIPDLHPGHYVRVDALLRPLPEKRNPSDFDYGAYLERHGYHAMASISDSSAVEILYYAPRIDQHVLTVIRSHVRHALEQHIDRPESLSILEALLLADRSGIDPEIRQSFARMGIAHLLAVSGLHVFLVGMILYGLLKPILNRFGWSWLKVEISRSVITLIMLLLYVAVVGAPVSAVRAVIMVTAFIGGRMLQRSPNSLNGLGAAAVVLLLFRPASLFDVGFQLSFSAVGALIILTPVFQQPIPLKWRQHSFFKSPINLVLASIIVTLGTMPVLLYHFGILPIGGLFLNVLAIPLTGWAVGGALLCVLLDGWATPLASAAGATSDLATFLLIEIGLRGYDWLDWSTIDFYLSDKLWIAAIVSGLIALCVWFRPRLRWKWVIAACCLISIGAWGPVIQSGKQPLLDVLFFDIGQGDATLIRTPDGKHILIDAGIINEYGDSGTRTIIPHLDRHRIRRLDAVIASHAHADHIGGIPAILNHIHVDTLYFNGVPFDSDPFHWMNETAFQQNVPIKSLQRGDVIDIDPALRIHVLHPDDQAGESQNDASVVLKMVYDEVSFLFTGDVEEEGERKMVERYGDLLCSTVVKAAHHGSRTSSTEAFVEQTASCVEFVIVQVARRNRYNLPNAEILDRWEEVGANVLSNADERAIWLQTDGRSVRRVEWR